MFIINFKFNFAANREERVCELLAGNAREIAGGKRLPSCLLNLYNHVFARDGRRRHSHYHP
jgi:hypothetical protein